MIQKDKIEKIKELIQNSKNILVLAHKNPDWDTIWAATAWYEFLKNEGKTVKLVCESKVPKNLQFIPNSEFLENDFDLEDFDLVIINDAWAKQVAWFIQSKPELYEKKIPTINIDHHKSNDMYWTLNIVIPVASTTCLIYKIFEELNYKITPNIATSLLTWIYTDTWSFMHSNTDSFTLKIASKLILLWGNTRLIAESFFNKIEISTLRLWWRVLEKVNKNEEWVVTSIVTKEDFTNSWAKYEELAWVVDYINSIPDSKYSFLLTEKDWEMVKGSLRTLNDDVDLTEIAWRFWGGGHKKAAWFTVWGKLQKETVWKIV